MSNVPHTSGPATQQLPPSYLTSQQPSQQPTQQPTQQGTVAAPQVFYQMGPGGQPQVYYSQQPMPVVTQPYMPLVTAPMGATIPVQYPPPNSYVFFSAIVMGICAFLNLTSIMFGIPALILSIQSEDSKRRLQYDIAKSRGNLALALTITNIVYTAATTCLIIGLVLGLRSYRYYGGYYYG